MSRPQFSLKSLLWLMVVVAAFFAGMAIQRHLDDAWAPMQRISAGRTAAPAIDETIVFPDRTG